MFLRAREYLSVSECHCLCDSQELLIRPSITCEFVSVIVGAYALSSIAGLAPSDTSLYLTHSLCLGEYAPCVCGYDSSCSPTSPPAHLFAIVSVELVRTAGSLGLMDVIIASA